jgi:methylated-DNA-[protein]-cysteine S-methyltransferase
LASFLITCAIWQHLKPVLPETLIPTEVNPPIWIAELPQSPLGVIWAAASADGMVAVDLWQDRERFQGLVSRLKRGKQVYEPDRMKAILEQIAAYLNGPRNAFDIVVDWSVMSPFQRDVLQQVIAVPYGRTTTYGEIAGRLGKPGAVRAVGRANATNPMPIVIPCHRVLGADGRLHGYSAPGGLETKAWLLSREGSWLI